MRARNYFDTYAEVHGLAPPRPIIEGILKGGCRIYDEKIAGAAALFIAFSAEIRGAKPFQE
jgi:hypothetical protein